MKQTSNHSALAEIPTVPIYGVPFSKLNMKQTVDYLTQSVTSGESLQVVTANPIMVMAALEDDHWMRIMQQADLIVPDGAGIVWAANFAGEPVAERVAGFDLLHELMRVGESQRWRVFLLGSSPEVVQLTAERLQEKYPEVQFVGARDGFFRADEDEAVIQQIREAAPHLLFVARGADTQEPWIAQHRHKLQVPVMMGVGGSFDIISGRSKRAPVWMQRMKLEWLYRLLREPKRFIRMLALPKFALKVIRDKQKVIKR
ncbi:WecB/TagA/CpsF family glycosyltransferase [Paenibacillus sp. 481]|uniref:WecB/TagA/CpsF family glycosyltransferase n=1 Tax=Paenibacillus sp. 481 TaxID=2835869 RepID=UPI001E63B316|nr:WecB/TagA/CpsF family glycosyltransferase [Paenibacillus sp. 481]UHA75690.1 WecB/TagA/CpsF family glycosyltransferase [Paenibacillus sp. 481]